MDLDFTPPTQGGFTAAGLAQERDALRARVAALEAMLSAVRGVVGTAHIWINAEPSEDGDELEQLIDALDALPADVRAWATEVSNGGR